MADFRPSAASSMWFIIIPLMVIGVLMAVLPVLLHSIREDRRLKAGTVDTAATAARESAFWNRTFRRGRVRPSHTRTE